MQTQYDNLKVSSPAPGHYIIDGLPAGSTQTEEGRLVHPMSVHIPPSLPSGLLLEIIRDRGEPMTATEILARESLAFAEKAANPLVVLESVKDSATEGNALLDGIIEHLKNYGNSRISGIAAHLNVDVDAIKALDGQGFELGNAGWVKLKEGGEA